MEFLYAAPCLVDDFLDFDEEEVNDQMTKIPCTYSAFSLFSSFSSENTPLFPVTEIVEEELEWISNKDAFPMVESLVDIMPNHSTFTTSSSHRSPVSVLESSSSSSINSSTSSGGATTTAISALTGTLKMPAKARSSQQRRRRPDLLGRQWQCWPQQKVKAKPYKTMKGSSIIGRKCLHCQAEKTPQWRAGPLGPKTLCNACGVRYKSGRLVPEYRPANSPTFSSVLHSNSHRKVVEMRRQKMGLEGVVLR